MYRLGIDMGGTKTAAGVVDEGFNLVAEKIIPTNVREGPAAILEDTLLLIRDVLRDAGIGLGDIPSIGIGCAGTIDYARGIVKYAKNLHFDEVEVAGPIERALGKKVHLENDANCAGIGEFLATENRREIQSFLMITLGTGIGSACVIDGKLYRGFNGAAPELGHCVIAADGLLCECGARGCWEMYCGGQALAESAREIAGRHPESRIWELAHGDPARIDGKCAFRAYFEGDAAGVEAVGRYLHYFRPGIANAINSFQPQVLAIGGGICEQGDVLIDAAREAVRTGSYCKTVEPATVRRAKLGAKAEVFGAAFLGSDLMG